MKTSLGVTMVMTTHDVYVKNFAHRVIWMRDGKIAKEERIPAERRAKALAELKDKLAAVLDSLNNIFKVL
jgi:putative ABC transport system ATP-binding protein